MEPHVLLEPVAVPDDPRLCDAWPLATLGAPSAWDLSTGAGVTIAILDRRRRFQPSRPRGQARPQPQLLRGQHGYWRPRARGRGARRRGQRCHLGSARGSSRQCRRDAVPPGVAITSPADGATLAKTVKIQVVAQDDVEVSRVDLMLALPSRRRAVAARSALPASRGIPARRPRAATSCRLGPSMPPVGRPRAARSPSSSLPPAREVAARSPRGKAPRTASGARGEPSPPVGNRPAWKGLSALRKTLSPAPSARAPVGLPPFEEIP